MSPSTRSPGPARNLLVAACLAWLAAGSGAMGADPAPNAYLNFIRDQAARSAPATRRQPPARRGTLARRP